MARAGHGSRFFVLRKPLLVRFCVVVWVFFSVFSIFCITSFGDCNRPQYQTAVWKVEILLQEILARIRSQQFQNLANLVEKKKINPVRNFARPR